MKKTKNKFMYILIGILLLGVAGVIAFMQHPLFGKAPSGERWARVQASPNFRDGSFQNVSPTPSLTEGSSYYDALSEMLFSKKSRLRPEGTIPAVKTDLHLLAPDAQVLVWFGHSSYFIQQQGLTFLVDPVLTKNASPVLKSNTAFEGADLYRPEDIPAIDYLILTHDHYDHLDYTTFKTIQSRVGHVVCPLGVGEHLVYWGYPEGQITELDWQESAPLSGGFHITATPTRHFSGRSWKRNQTLWCAYVLQHPSYNIYIGGDSGYDTHFKAVGQQYGPFDLAILENGQYDNNWKYIHMLPEEVLLAAQELGAKHLMPAHSGKFKLANHAWDEPLARITEANRRGPQLSLWTPQIGQPVNMLQDSFVFTSWWKDQ